MTKLIKSELSEMCSRCTPAQIAEELTNKYGQKVGIEVIRRALSHFNLKALGREKYQFVDDLEDVDTSKSNIENPFIN